MDSKETFDEFLKEISKIVNECERREEDANFKVCESLVKKINTLENALSLIVVAVKAGHKSNCSLTEIEIGDLLSNLKKLKLIWINKKSEQEKVPVAADFCRYAAPKENTSTKGRPKYIIDLDYVLTLRQDSFKLKRIAVN